jgi:NAD(P)-dependent dehydrogenase (short-subunit alcohol dehydrogenase family)
MSEKNYVVVGGSSGIGLRLTELLLKDGYNVWVLSRRKPVTDQAGTLNWIEFDVLNDDVEKLELPSEIKGLAYCPGSINLRPFRGLKPESFRDDLEINLIGAVKVIKAALKPLQAAGSSSIVLFSTVAVNQGMPFHASIAAAKGAVEGLSRSLAAELAPKVRVNCIAPSLTDTPLAEKLLSTPQKQEASAQRHPLKKVGSVNDLASMAAFLLSDNSSWVTGQVIGVDGGLSSLKI